MRRSCSILLLALPLIGGGCHSADSGKAAAVAETGLSPATRPALPREALLTLDQIQPPVELPATRPSTRSSTQPSQAPLEAIQLFARARAALEAGHRFTAVQLLDQALAIDPDSFELNLAMGQAAGGTTLAARSMPSLERAAQINPDDPNVYVEMSRSYMRNGDSRAAIKALRTAQQTTSYKTGHDSSVVVDYMLARTLQMSGYDTAALREYELLLNRIARTGDLYRGPLEVMQAIRSPDLVFNEIAQLAARLGQTRKALSAIEQAMVEAPDNLQYAISRVRLLQQAGRNADARDFMPRLISSFGDNVEVTTLLAEVYGPSGAADAARSLRAAFDRDPSDANLGFALASLLQREGKRQGAEQILQRLADRLEYRQDVAGRLHDFYEAQGQTLAAARVLVQASALHPEDLSEHAIRMGRLARLSRSNHLRLSDLQNLQVEDWAEAARLYWVARLGEMWDRDELARGALERAVRQGKPYPPAYRSLVGHYWARRDWDNVRKLQASREIISLAESRGNHNIAAELRGIVSLHQGNVEQASASLLESMRDGTAEPDVLLAYAAVQQKRGNPTEAERILLKITDDYPLFEQSYLALIGYYRQRGSANMALKTLQRWLTADPRNPTARLFEGSLLILAGRTETGEKILLDLFDEHADNAQVLMALQDLYVQSNRLDTFINLLEQKRQGRPDIREIAERLVDIYAQQQRMSEANRVLEDLRRSAAGDSDLLYYVSHLYLRIDDRKSAETILEDVLKIDPNHSSAANDLGYYMAEENRDLDRAQELVDIAVKEEPDNQAFLDSYGWVLYKRGRFDEALTYLERAIAQTVNPDPIVLDHLGDAYYRAGRPEDAVKRWGESNQSLPEAQQLRSEFKTLKLQLQQKLRQQRQKQPVQVAPSMDEVQQPR